MKRSSGMFAPFCKVKVTVISVSMPVPLTSPSPCAEWQSPQEKSAPGTLPFFHDAPSCLWRNRRHQMVLHFEGENADHRLINAFLGESSMLDCLLDRLKIVPQFRYAGSSKTRKVLEASDLSGLLNGIEVGTS